MTSRVALKFALAAGLAVALTGDAAGQGRATGPLLPIWRTLFARPAGIPAPPGNPSNPAKATLGERLFFDPRLSGDNARSCASCHDPEQGYSNGLPRGIARDGGQLRRHVPSLFNLAWGESFLWDGSEPSLETQIDGPIEAADEMAGRWPAIATNLAADAEMARAFAAAFGDEAVTRTRVLKALSAYVRTLVSPESRFDRFIAGDGSALTVVELQGFRLFVGKAGCVACHSGWRFTDERFHDTGLPGEDPGRGAVPGGTPGTRVFKTPGLRGLNLSAPYMHDGSLATLEAVVEHYTDGIVVRAGLSSSLTRPLSLSLDERTSLIAFLRTLDVPPP
ncbi:MAG: cytochrome c peroxidase [Hyphomicrobiaceae bacterium]|nr:cytochrome c peroxidase [Hyphomicrobiaceae bacterium]